MKPYRVLIAGLLAAVLSAAFMQLPGTGPAAVPTISLQSIDGRHIPLDGPLSGPALITFWASDCAVCIEEVPHINALYRDFADSGLAVVAIAMPYDLPNNVAVTAARYGIAYPVALDLRGEAASAFGGIAGTPTTFLAAPGGKILMRHTGAINMHDVRRQLREISRT